MNRKVLTNRKRSLRRMRESQQGRRVVVSIIAVLVFFMVLAMIAFLLF